jgi:hypothetical protein
VRAKRATIGDEPWTHDKNIQLAQKYAHIESGARRVRTCSIATGIGCRLFDEGYEDESEINWAEIGRYMVWYA